MYFAINRLLWLVSRRVVESCADHWNTKKAFFFFFQFSFQNQKCLVKNMPSDSYAGLLPNTPAALSTSRPISYTFPSANLVYNSDYSHPEMLECITSWFQVDAWAQCVFQSSAASSGLRERRHVLFLVCGKDSCLDGQRRTASRGEGHTRELL